MSQVVNRPKEYWAIKYRLAILETLYFVVLIIGAGVFKITPAFFSWAQHAFRAYPIAFIFYFSSLIITYNFLNFPFSFYHSYRLEHNFGLSNQNFRSWLLDYFKQTALSSIISLILLSVFYAAVSYFQYTWWIWVAVFWILFSLFLAKLVPIIIIPLFYKTSPISDEPLKKRIVLLAEKLNIKLIDVFEIELSKKTLKANAAFTGLGKTRRVLLGDTLKDKYTQNEIELIVAHELAHFHYRHIWKLISINACFITGSLYLIFRTAAAVTDYLQMESIASPGSFLVLVGYLTGLEIIFTPLKNFCSCYFERQADNLALKLTQNKESFITMMEKLSQQNLSDPSPSFLAKIFFYDHPPVNERIEAARNFKNRDIS